MNNIEERLWSYIDGTCSGDERLAIERLLAADPEIKAKYNDMVAFEAELANNLEVDEPSMAFTYNVIEQIRAEQALKPLKARVDERIITGIAAFFVIVICAGLLFTLSAIDWSTGGNVTAFQQQTQKFTNIFEGQGMNLFLLFDLMLALYFADSWLRGRKAVKTA